MLSLTTWLRKRNCYPPPPPTQTCWLLGSHYCCHTRDPPTHHPLSPAKPPHSGHPPTQDQTGGSGLRHKGTLDSKCVCTPHPENSSFLTAIYQKKSQGPASPEPFCLAEGRDTPPTTHSFPRPQNQKHSYRAGKMGPYPAHILCGQQQHLPQGWAYTLRSKAGDQGCLPSLVPPAVTALYISKSPGAGCQWDNCIDPQPGASLVKHPVAFPLVLP